MVSGDECGRSAPADDGARVAAVGQPEAVGFDERDDGRAAGGGGGAGAPQPLVMEEEAGAERVPGPGFAPLVRLAHGLEQVGGAMVRRAPARVSVEHAEEGAVLAPVGVRRAGAGDLDEGRVRVLHVGAPALHAGDGVAQPVARSRLVHLVGDGTGEARAQPPAHLDEDDSDDALLDRTPVRLAAHHSLLVARRSPLATRHSPLATPPAPSTLTATTRAANRKGTPTIFPRNKFPNPRYTQIFFYTVSN